MSSDAREACSKRRRRVKFRGHALRLGMNWTEEDLANLKRSESAVPIAWSRGHDKSGGASSWLSAEADPEVPKRRPTAPNGPLRRNGSGTDLVSQGPEVFRAPSGLHAPSTGIRS